MDIQYLIVSCFLNQNMLMLFSSILSCARHIESLVCIHVIASLSLQKLDWMFDACCECWHTERKALSNLTLHLIDRDICESRGRDADDYKHTSVAEPVILRPSCAPVSVEVLCGEKGLASKPQASQRALAWAELCLHGPHRLPASAPWRCIMLQLINNSRLILVCRAKPQ